MKDVKKYLVELFDKTLYGVSMFGANLATKSLLFLIKSKGLDPNADPEKLMQNRFAEELNVAFGGLPRQKGRFGGPNKIVKKVPWDPKDQPRTGYSVKDDYSGASVTNPDYDDISKGAFNSLLQLAEKLDKTYQVTPATIVPPEGASTAYVTECKDWKKKAIKSLTDSMSKEQDIKIFEVLESNLADQSILEQQSIIDRLDKNKEKLFNLYVELGEKRVETAKKKPKKAAKKPAKKK